jgi:site-specific DNA-cytosine methylase
MKKLKVKNTITTNETKAAKIVEIAATAANPILLEIPTNEKELAQFIGDKEKELAEMQLLGQEPDQPEGYYKQLHAKTQELACIKLQAEGKLAVILRKLPSAQGKRSDLNKPTANMSKQEAAAKYGLSPTQRKQIEKLTEDAVKEAIREAILANDIPTRAKALVIVRDKVREENNKDFDCRNVFAKARPAIEGDLKKYLSQLKATSLFACGGVGTALIHKMGVQVSVGSELLKPRADFHQLLHGKTCEMVVGDINENIEKIVSLHKERGCKVIIATPPCQDFTPLNSSKRDYSNIKRSALFMPMLEVLKGVNDMNEYFVLENVKEYLEAAPSCLEDILKGKTIAEYIIHELKGMGYKEVNWAILDASFYGVCQGRKRLIITASKHGLWEMPKPDTFQKMLWEVIGDLPSLANGEDSGILWHKTALIPTCQEEFLKNTPTGSKAVKPCNPDGTPFKGQKERKCRNNWNISGTITTGNGEILGDKVWHPGRKKPDETYSDCRCFTILELLRITGLSPEDFPIPTDTPERLIRELLGEALMPTLLNRIFETIPMPKV